jgi:acyl-CoA thioesterase
MASFTPMSDPHPPRHPFADLIGLTVEDALDGKSRCHVALRPELLNPHGVAHGAVAYALADTGMGAALYTLLDPGESCATIEIKIVYLATARAGVLVCNTRVIRKGSRVAVLDSEIFESDRLVAVALGTYSILNR